MEKIEVYTLKEVAEILKLNYKTIQHYAKAEQLKTVKIGGRRRVTQENLKKFLEEGTEANYYNKLGFPSTEKRMEERRKQKEAKKHKEAIKA